MIMYKTLTRLNDVTADKNMEDYYLQSGAIWVDGLIPESIQAQVIHYNKEKKIVFCSQKVNFGFTDIEPDMYTLEEFLRYFAFMGVKNNV